MSQRFKSIYFSDCPSEMPHQKNVTLAFGDKDSDLYETVKALSSEDVRHLMEHPTFYSLYEGAEQAGLPVNTYCLRLLRDRVHALHRYSVQPQLPGIGLGGTMFIDPIQTTFKGGEAEPLHTWYPFLEGYSPRFVEQILEEFCGQATRILDPFAGTGTTPLTASRLGMSAFYCELNPLLQYLTEVKIIALTLDEYSRNRLVLFLRSLVGGLHEFLADSAPDSQLRETYATTFGSSRFFDEETCDRILRARTAVDRLARTEPLFAKFVTVAVISSLIPSSLLIRRGDVRFKTRQELGRLQVDFIHEVARRLSIISNDVQELAPVRHSPRLLCEDARQLGKLPPLNIEAVVTSPPYLNGTNYFRNTKLELWFLRCLLSAQDLSSFRRKAVTAGINDVTVGKQTCDVNGSVREIVARLQASAYDPRIPRMVAAYFSDMRTVFSGVRKHLVDDATLAVDIGDSSYGGVHVPTDALLAELLASLGFVLERETTLRRRMSRCGIPLRQVLMVFRGPGARGEPTSKDVPTLQTDNHPGWQRFKSDLPHQHGAFARRNWGHPLHSLCSYQGKMKPSLASHLVDNFVGQGGSLLDPFAGVGTIPFEAALRGIKAWAFEINTAALHITAAKLGKPNLVDCGHLLDRLESFIAAEEASDTELAQASLIRFNGPLPDYFHPRTLEEILLARRYFSQHQPKSPSESLVLAAILHILHGNRPYALSRRSHPITPFAPSGSSEYRPLMPRLRDKVNRSIFMIYPDEFVPGEALYQDATSWWPEQIDRLDAVITSPPFFDSTRFYLANWMRLWFSGWELSDFRTRPLAFMDERQKVGFGSYEPIFRQARERLKTGGVMLLHLGKSRKCDMAEALGRVARPWFNIADVFVESVSHCESHGIRDKGTVTSHQYLLLH